MTDEELTGLRRLSNAATAAPWTDAGDGDVEGPNGGAVAHVACHASMHTMLRRLEDYSRADAALIAAARNALPGLLDDLAALRRVREAAEAVVASLDRCEDCDAPATHAYNRETHDGPTCDEHAKPCCGPFGHAAALRSLTAALEAARGVK